MKQRTLVLDQHRESKKHYKWVSGSQNHRMCNLLPMWSLRTQYKLPNSKQSNQNSEHIYLVSITTIEPISTIEMFQLKNIEVSASKQEYFIDEIKSNFLIDNLCKSQLVFLFFRLYIQIFALKLRQHVYKKKLILQEI